MCLTLMYNCHYPSFPTTHPHFLSSPYGDIPRIIKIFTKKDNSIVIREHLPKGLNLQVGTLWISSNATLET